MTYELVHNHPGSAVESMDRGDCAGCRSRAVAVIAVERALAEALGDPTANFHRAAWEAVVKAESILRFRARKDAQIVPNAISHAHPTNHPSEGVPSDQRRNQTSETPAENRGEGRASTNCIAGMCSLCESEFNCSCKCHVHKAAYSS